MRLVLASTSPYRRVLLERLGVPFVVANPGVREERLPGEAPGEMARRLAQRKAEAVAGRFRDALVIGCDQVAVSGDQVLDKPGNHDNARRQLRALSGRDAVFHTAVCLRNAATATARTRVVESRVTFRELDEAVIDRYLEREPSYDCAGSAKLEGLGIALVKRVEGEDPSALIGLPLIALVDLLREEGLDVL